MFNIFDNEFLLNNLWVNKDNYRRYVNEHERIGGLERTLLAFDWDNLNHKEHVIRRVAAFLYGAAVGCAQPVFVAEGPNGTGKTHVIAGMCRWLILNKGLSYPGYELEWVNWPAYQKNKLDGTLSREPNWKCMLLVLEDFDSAMAISSRTQNAYGLRDLLAILRDRLEMHRSLPTLMSVNKSLKTKAGYPLLDVLSVDTQGNLIEEAAKNAKTLTDLLIGNAVRVPFATVSGNSYRDTILHKLENWKRTNIERHQAADPEILLGLEGEF